MTRPQRLVSRRAPPGVAAVLSLAWLPVAALAAPAPRVVAGPVSLQVPGVTPHEGEAMPFSIQEDVAGPVFIDGCAAVELELKTGGKWVTTAVKVCDSQVPATQIEGDLAFSIPAPSSATYRAILTWGAGCAPGFPLATATCAEMGSVTSDPFVVAPRVQK